jgi:hypothetical protein
LPLQTSKLSSYPSILRHNVKSGTAQRQVHIGKPHAIRATVSFNYLYALLVLPPQRAEKSRASYPA